MNKNISYSFCILSLIFLSNGYGASRYACPKRLLFEGEISKKSIDKKNKIIFLAAGSYSSMNYTVLHDDGVKKLLSYDSTFKAFSNPVLRVKIDQAEKQLKFDAKKIVLLLPIATKKTSLNTHYFYDIYFATHDANRVSMYNDFFIKRVKFDAEKDRSAVDEHECLKYKNSFRYAFLTQKEFQQHPLVVSESRN
ncbi:MAG: hypothetical protein ACJAZS_000835 [Alteromonas naphthalenivorans]|jgi:hypothetical protein